MLSFEVNAALFNNEIDEAINTLYMTTWLQEKQSSLQEKLDGLMVARGQLQTQIDRAQADYTAAIERLPALQTHVSDLSAQIDLVQNEAGRWETILQSQAEANLRGPAWKRGLRVIAAVAKALPIPQAQPWLAAIGTGLDFATNVNTTDPLEFIGNLKDPFAEFKSHASEYGDSAENFVETLLHGHYGTMKEKVASLKNLAEPFRIASEGINAALKKTEAPEGALEKELNKLKASDPVFSDLVNQTKDLLAKKSAIADELTAVTQAVSRLSNEITANLLAMDGLTRDLAQGSALMDDRVISYLKQMERDSRFRLLKYHYYMAKAYEYRMLKPYIDPLNLDGLTNQALQLARQTNSGPLPNADTVRDVLRPLYQNQLEGIVSSIFTQYNSNPPARQTPVRFNLTPEELDQLNTGLPLTFNPMAAGIFGADEEDLRIYKVRIYGTPQTSFVGPAPTQFAYLDLDVEHGGSSRLMLSGQTYAFEHFTGATLTPLVWSTRYDVLHSQASEQIPSPADESMLKTLLQVNHPISTDNLLLYSLPGAWGDLKIAKAVNTNNGSDIHINSLTLEITYDFRVKPNEVKTLEVRVPSTDISPYIQVNRADRNGRKDGIGDFRRSYTTGQAVTITAESTYGRWIFDRWTNKFGQELNPPVHQPSLSVVMDANKTFVAQYFHNPLVPPDFDGDDDVDQVDLSALTACVSGPAILYAGGCAAKDLDSDGDVDQGDFGLLQRCFSGSGIVVDPTCAVVLTGSQNSDSDAAAPVAAGPGLTIGIPWQSAENPPAAFPDPRRHVEWAAEDR